MPFCPECGKSVGSSSQKFCRNCGASLIEESPDAAPNPPEAVFKSGAFVCRACGNPIRPDDKFCSRCLVRVPDDRPAVPPANLAPSTSAAEPAYPVCASCGSPVSVSAEFCGMCGTPREAAKPSQPAQVPAAPPAPSPGKFCGSCGAALSATAKFCGSCGTPVKTTPGNY